MIEIKNVSKKYGNFIAVDNISFNIKKGEIVGLLGPNGAGKSTTMNMITGFIEQTEGEIIIDGIDILKKPKQAKKQIGYMPEGIPLYNDLTVKEFITYMADLKMVTSKVKKEKVQKVIEQTNLKEVENKLIKNLSRGYKQIGYMPEGVPLYNDLTVKEFVSYMADLKEVIKKEKKDKVQKVIEQTDLRNVQNKLIKNLSRGYKQRVSLAGALVGDPEMLILDEPTVGLDPKQITEIRNLIKGLGKTHTIILSSHILSEISQICNKVIIINYGKIIAEDTPKNLEEKVKKQNQLSVTVEDKETKIEEVTKQIKGIKEMKLVKDNEDGTKEYVISVNENQDIRKEIFERYAKNNITIFELKKNEATLEDAFMKLIEEKQKEEEEN